MNMHSTSMHSVLVPSADSILGTDKSQFVDRLLAWFERAGQNRYDEEVTQSAHALQAAWLATEAMAEPAQVVATLFHDIGHLLIDEHTRRENFQKWDGNHEYVGATWLETLFPPSVSAPVRLHVAAKRWLCARKEGYWEKLSKASRISLALQGGPMTRDEVDAFEDQPYWCEAVALRIWDDEAKVMDRDVPGFDCYRDVIEEMIVH